MIALGNKETRLMKNLYLAKHNLNFSVQCHFALNLRVDHFAACFRVVMHLCDTSSVYEI